MIAGILLRSYKNYNNIKFIPVCSDYNHKFTAFIGNNGVGKSAVLESLDVFFNDREWNVTHGAKATEAYICIMFLIKKEKTVYKKDLIEKMSEYFWNANKNINANFKSTPELKKLLDYKDALKKQYYSSHYLLFVGTGYGNTKVPYFATFEDSLKKNIGTTFGYTDEELDKELFETKQMLKDSYSYIYIPVEASPKELLQLQNTTMQKLLNKDLLNEIEKILNKASGKKDSIVKQINDRLDLFMEDVNNVITQVEEFYEFKNAQGYKKNLSAKDIREKILEAYFPLRALKVNGLPIDQLSSGEQRKAIIDVAYSIIASNGDKKTDKEVILGIDEPESSMHISNCFKHFQLLESLSSDYSKQIVITTHWYGFIPVSHNGNLNYIEVDENNKSEITCFSLYNIMEDQRRFPDAIELKSMFDLATSIITYMRVDNDTSWIICEGSDDKIYLECILDGYNNVNILPMGGCGNVIKLYSILYSSLTEGNEEKNGNVLFLIDTDRKQAPNANTIKFSGKHANVKLRRLQIESGLPTLVNPDSLSTYEQTEIEDCLIPELYFNAVKNQISKTCDSDLIKLINNYDIDKTKGCSKFRNDDSCLKPKTIEALEGKEELIKFVEEERNKKAISMEYRDLYYNGESRPNHVLKEVILKELQRL